MKNLFLILNFYAFIFLSKCCVSPNLEEVSSKFNLQLGSKSLLENVDLSLDPCDNFYKFSCGTWIKAREKESKYSRNFSYSNTDTHFQKFVDEALDGKYDDESAAIKTVNNLKKKCIKLPFNKIQTCDRNIMNFGLYAISSLFMSKNRIDSDKHNDYAVIQDIIRRIKEELRLLINEKKDIFDDKSRDNLLRKLYETEFTTKFDEDDISNVLLMENCYKEIGISENDRIEKILENIDSMSKMNYTDNYCGEKIFKVSVYLNGFVINGAGYHKEYNKFFIYPSALKEPLFNRHFPYSLNYGNIGFVIAHEILHAFDSDSYKLIFGPNNKSTVILTPESIENSEKKIKCFVKQYGGQKESVTGLNVNGTLTLDENIADNGGLKIAHRAYMKYLQSIGGEEPRVPGLEDFNSEQLFFISFGRTFCEHNSKEILEEQIKIDSHTPAELRTIMALSNYKPFSNAFKCELNSKMNPEDKCELWKN
uniref:Peptidase_M13 domain-containing protein n=1 Tax=Strongyloides papillosus TaxID=174720 RepID=A0A0N5B1Q2_STREA